MTLFVDGLLVPVAGDNAGDNAGNYFVHGTGRILCGFLYESDIMFKVFGITFKWDLKEAALFSRIYLRLDRVSN